MGIVAIGLLAGVMVFCLGITWYMLMKGKK